MSRRYWYTITAVSIPLIITFIYLYGAQSAHYLYRIAALNPIPLLVIFVIAPVLAVLATAKTKDASAAVIVIVIGVITALLLLVPLSYLKNQAYYDSVTIKEAAADDITYQERPPYDVAVAVSDRALGDTTGDSTGMVKSLPATGDNGMYSTSIIRRGMFKGYESAQIMDLPLYGTAGNKNVQFCHYNEDAKLRFGGMAPSNNLWRAIAWKTPLDVISRRSDAFVTCDGDTPMLYAPLVNVQGFLAPVDVPYGVAVYNGSTGELTIEKNMDTDIPVYPQSIATKQRKSTAASGSFTDYIFWRAGFEDTSVDENDPNGENRADFGLAKNGDSHYVSPLTPRGSSSSITALGDIQSDTINSSELNLYTIYTYPEGQSRQANSSIAQRITGEVLDGYRAQGLTVFEIVPADNGNWVASIGNSQNIRYRAVIDQDGKITLIDDNGSDVGEDGVESQIDTGKNIQDMSIEELREMMDQIMDEIINRSAPVSPQE